MRFTDVRIEFLLAKAPFPVRILLQNMPFESPKPSTTQSPTGPMKCSDPSINILSSGKFFHIPQSHYVTDTLELEAEVSIQCNATVLYSWTVTDEVSTIEEHSGDNLQVLKLAPFALPIGRIAICLNMIPRDAESFNPLTECRHFHIKLPKIVAIIQNQDVNNALFGETLTLDPTLSYDSLDVSGVPSSMKPQTLSYEWSCALVIGIDTPSGYVTGDPSKGSFCTSEEYKSIASSHVMGLCDVHPQSLGLVENVWYSFKV